MKCPECDGTGKVVHPMMSMNGDEYTGEWEQHECEACNGTGKVKKTNFDYITSSTERLASFIRTVTEQCHECGATGKVKIKGCAVRQTFAPDFFFLPCMDKAGTEDWLKEEHHDEA